MKSRIVLGFIAVAISAGAFMFLSPYQGAVSQAHAEGEMMRGHGPGPVSADSGPRLAYEQNTIDIIKQYGPSVVAVNVTVKGARVNPLQNVPPQLQPFFKQLIPPDLSQPRQSIERAAGSGFVVDKEGQIITNYHVVRNALEGDSAKLSEGAKVTVRFPGVNEELPVEIVGVDQTYDLALLQVKDKDKVPSSVAPIPLADSDQVQVGEKAVAIGNPFGLQSTVTQGIVSAINRRQQALASGVPIAYIQTDAAINPGNSGGPLIDSKGHVIGINDEILAPNGTFIGVGFAIPSNLINEHLAQLKGGGFIKKAEMGVSIISLRDYPDSVRETLNLPDTGVMIERVLKNSPADKAGLQGAQFTVGVGGQQWPAGGDIITEADGEKIKDASQLQSMVFSKKAGDIVKLKVLHKGHEKTVKVKLAIIKHKHEQGESMQQ